MRSESYAFIWQPKVLICSFLGLAVIGRLWAGGLGSSRVVSWNMAGGQAFCVQVQTTESNHASSISGPAEGGGRSPCRQAWGDKGQRAQGRLEEHVRVDDRKRARRHGCLLYTSDA